jgi:hypothetical protein
MICFRTDLRIAGHIPADNLFDWPVADAGLWSADGRPGPQEARGHLRDGERRGTCAERSKSSHF